MTNFGEIQSFEVILRIEMPMHEPGANEVEGQAELQANIFKVLVFGSQWQWMG